MAASDGGVVVYRYAWIAGIAGIALALARLDGLVRDTVEGAPWQLVVIAGAMLGAIITWTALTYRAHAAVVAVVNVAALVVVSARIAVPDTTVALLPTLESFRALRTELSYALEVIRSGVAPVIPATGLVVVITAVFWLVGMLLVLGLMRGLPYLAVVPPGVLYLQLATADRSFGGMRWTLAFLAFVGGSLAAITFDERAASPGRLSRGRRRAGGGVVSAASMSTVVVALALGLVATSAAAGTVPGTGVLDWRRSSGLTGDYFGGIAYNPFISIQKSLVSLSEVPVFSARLDGDVDPRRVYWRLLTMDTFNGIWWYASGPEMSTLDDERFESRGEAFLGPTARLTQDVVIQQLRMDWLPSAYSPTGFGSEDVQVQRGVRVAGDGSLRFGSISFEGMRYAVESAVPVPDVAALALGDGGTPTDVFATAFEDGLLGDTDVPSPRDLGDAERYLALPDDLDPRITTLAIEIVRGKDSDYERGLTLEHYLRSPANGFRYSLEVDPGSQSGDLATWLFEAEGNVDYRVGYCEQYATAMGVLARAAGIPSRVVLGFTPGDVQGDVVTVRDRNAHAWVELWMPTQGWVRFDPTPRGDGVNPSTAADVIAEYGIDPELLEPEALVIPPIETGPLPPPLIADDQPIPGGLGTGAEEPAPAPFRLPGWLGNLAVVAAALAAVLGLLPGLKMLRRRRRLQRLRQGDVTAAWEEIVSRLSDLGDGPGPAETPFELARRTDRAMRPLAAVYAERVYGPAHELAPEQVERAAAAFTATEATFPLRYSPTQRALAWYRPGTLLPDWTRRRIGRNGNGGNGSRR